MKIPYVKFGESYKQIRKEILKEIDRVLSSGDLILREDVEKFEENFAKYVGSKYCVGVNSGTDALYLSLKALGIKQGDKVMVPSYTFVATAQVVKQLKAELFLYDVGEKFEDLKNIKAIMVSHMAGEFMTDMEKLKEKAGDIPIIEDACQALGAIQNNKKAGTFGITGCFSFYPAKILGCYGDGGAIVTDNKMIYNEVKELRNHYKKDYSKWGINSRLDNLQAAILNVKLKYLDKVIARREEIAQLYLKGLGYRFTEDRGSKRVWQDFIILEHNRDLLFNHLKEKGIETMENDYFFPIEKCMDSIRYEAQTLRLPVNEAITDKEVKFIIKSIKEFYVK